MKSNVDYPPLQMLTGSPYFYVPVHRLERKIQKLPVVVVETLNNMADTSTCQITFW